MDPETQAVLTFLRKALSLVGYSHQEVARRLGVSRSSISRLLSGNEELRLNDLNRICQAVDWDTQEVLTMALRGQPTHRWLAQLRDN